MTIDISQFANAFFEEAEELLAEMERLLLEVDVEQRDLEKLNAIFRTAHSIKGGAGTFGMADMAQVTHVLESLLDRLRNGEMDVTIDHIDVFLEAKDVLKHQLEGHQKNRPVGDHDANVVMEKLNVLATAVYDKVAADEIAGASGAEANSEPAVARNFEVRIPRRFESSLAGIVDALDSLGIAKKEDDDAEFHTISLVTTRNIPDILEAVGFFVNEDDIEIRAGLIGPDANEQAALAEVQKAREDAQGYGFFEPLDQPENSQSEQDEGFGFFDPLPDANASITVNQGSVQDEGFGFFDNIELPGGVSQPATPAQASASAPAPAPAPVSATAKAGSPKDAVERRSSARNQASTEASSIRVHVEKVDQLVNLVGELMITQSMLERRVAALDAAEHEGLHRSIKHLQRNTRDLQESVMSIRMMPMDYVFSRYPRMVRDLANRLGKKVELVTVGAATELDKGLIEGIIDPLTHLVRNSIDHGIETPEARIAAGKSETGRITLSAAHQGGNIVIEVSDDGHGMSRERILKKALERGMDVSDAMSDSEVYQLIFAPGFSTAEIVTDVSGRGVGMDVVKRNIMSMGGIVTLSSVPGEGSTISISLPLTLAILDGMTIACGKEEYILPLNFVIESLRPAPQDVKQISGEGLVLRLRGEVMPIVGLHDIFGLKHETARPEEGIVVILESDGRRAALWVDALVGQQQVVVKNIESNYKKVAGISGATIMGDGSVSLIIDVATLLRHHL